VSLITNAVPKPLLTKLSPVPFPLLVRSNEVERPESKTKAISRPVVVVMVLPVLYAACNPKGAPLHLTTWSDPSKQMALPGAILIPIKARYELLVSIVTA